jgi:hypothetical protein
MNYFDSDMYNSTLRYYDGKDDNLYFCLRAMSHTIYSAKFEQTITHQQVLLRIVYLLIFDILIIFSEYRCLKR